MDAVKIPVKIIICSRIYISCIPHKFTFDYLRVYIFILCI